jgi:hypothetical protein
MLPRPKAVPEDDIPLWAATGLQNFLLPKNAMWGCQLDKGACRAHSIHPQTEATLAVVGRGIRRGE